VLDSNPRNGYPRSRISYRDVFPAEPDFLVQGEKINEGFAPMSAHHVETVVGTLVDTAMRRQGMRIQ
jgi:hypothetical protein